MEGNSPTQLNTVAEAESAKLACELVVKELLQTGQSLPEIYMQGESYARWKTVDGNGLIWKLKMPT